MGFDPDIVGRTGEVTRHEWTARDTSLYALGIGAGAATGTDLRYLVENLTGGSQRAYPMMALALGTSFADRPSFGPIDRSQFLHAGQELALHRELPPSGTVQLQAEVTGVYDQGTGAIITWQTQAELITDRGPEPAFTLNASGFLRGAGGFGGPRFDASSQPSVPARAPDRVLSAFTHPDQALLYRLSGDLNPLHADPAIASAGGFERPILHGLCVLGIAARTILDHLGRADLRGLQCRFTAVVFPGERLSVHTWRDEPDVVAFQVRNERDAVVVDRGRVTL